MKNNSPWKICAKRCCFSHFPEQFELNKMLFCRLLSFLPVDSYVENCQNRDGSQVEKYQVKPINVNLKKKRTVSIKSLDNKVNPPLYRPDPAWVWWAPPLSRSCPTRWSRSVPRSPPRILANCILIVTFCKFLKTRQTLHSTVIEFFQYLASVSIWNMSALSGFWLISIFFIYNELNLWKLGSRV